MFRGRLKYMYMYRSMVVLQETIFLDLAIAFSVEAILHIIVEEFHTQTKSI